MNGRILRGGEMMVSLGIDDRGLNYGDGVFETLLVHAGQPVWWSRHWHRLTLGASLLGIPVPEESLLLEQAQALCAGQMRAVLKLVLTRGAGGRGYLPPEEVLPTSIFSLHAMPASPGAPVALRWCETTLAPQPLLAGFKHLNRLENVLARNEWRDDAIFEGLLCDTEGRVIGATAANVFVRSQDRWLTPRVDRCGIAGLVRGWLLDHLDAVDEADFGPETLLAADAVFLCNSVRGILPVGRLEDRQWPADDAIRELRQQLAAAEPAFAFRE